MKKMSCPCTIHPSMVVPSRMLVHSWPILEIKENHYVIELAKEQAIVVGEVCTSPNCSQIATDPSQ